MVRMTDNSPGTLPALTFSLTARDGDQTVEIETDRHVYPEALITNTGSEPIGSQPLVVTLSLCIFESPKVTVDTSSLDEPLELEGVISEDGTVLTVSDVPLNLAANEVAVLAPDVAVWGAGDLTSPWVNFELGTAPFASGRIEYFARPSP